MSPENAAALALALPLVAAASLVAIGRLLPPWVPDLLALTSGILVGALFALLLAEAARAPVVVWFGGWLPRDGEAIGIAFFVDGFAAGFGLLVSFLFVASLMFALGLIQEGRELFHALMLMFLAGMSGLCMSADLFNAFVFLELTSIAAFALTAYRRSESPLEAAVGFTITNSIGGLVFLLGVGVIYGRTGTLSFAAAGRELAMGPADGLVLLAFTLLMSGLLVKAAIAPFHFWLVDAHAVAPSPVSVLFSGAMVALGLYLLARIYWNVFAAFGPPQDAVRDLLVGLGAFTAALGAVLAFLQRHLKRLLAFSTVSHMGAILVGIGVLSAEGLAGAGLYVLGHGLVKGALFVGAGVLLALRASIDELELRGRGRGLPATGLLFAAGGLALAGLPGVVGHSGKALIEGAAEHAGYGWTSPILLGSAILTGAAVLRAAGRIFLGLGSREEGQSIGPSEPEEEKPSRPGWLMLAPAGALFSAAVVMDWLPQVMPAVLEHAAGFVSQDAVAALLLDGGAWISASPPVPHLPGPARGLFAAGAAILLAASMLYREALPQVLVRSIQGSRVLRVLQDLHSGHVGDYTAWLLAGVAAIGGFMTAAGNGH